jgi:hypothetical protein
MSEMKTVVNQYKYKMLPLRIRHKAAVELQENTHFNICSKPVSCSKPLLGMQELKLNILQLLPSVNKELDFWPRISVHFPHLVYASRCYHPRHLQH